MTDSIAAGSPAATAHGYSRLRAYARLGKLDVYDYYLGIFLALTAALFPAGAFTARQALVMGVFLAGEVAVLMAMVALDDVTGFRDGSDLANYAPTTRCAARHANPWSPDADGSPGAAVRLGLRGGGRGAVARAPPASRRTVRCGRWVVAVALLRPAVLVGRQAELPRLPGVLPGRAGLGAGDRAVRPGHRRGWTVWWSSRR